MHESKTSTDNNEPRTQNPDPRTQNPEPRTQNPEPRTQNPEPRTQNPEPLLLGILRWSSGGTGTVRLLLRVRAAVGSGGRLRMRRTVLAAGRRGRRVAGASGAGGRAGGPAMRPSYSGAVGRGRRRGVLDSGCLLYTSPSPRDRQKS